MKNEECCPRFNPGPWNNKEFEWHNKKFVKTSVKTAFFVPLNFGSVMKMVDAKVRKAGANFVDNMGLSEHTSKWNMNLYSAVDKEVKGLENITISGKFYSKVYEGDFKETGNWAKDFEKTLAEKNIKTKKLYMWYTTCPKCAKKYGENYTVFVGQIE